MFLNKSVAQDDPMLTVSIVIKYNYSDHYYVIYFIYYLKIMRINREGYERGSVYNKMMYNTISYVMI